MKKNLAILLFFLITGLFIGNNIYNRIDILPTFKEDNTFYLLQQGIYSDKDTMQKETRDINPKIYELKDDKYYVYVGITGNNENLEKLKDIYTKQNIEIYTKKIKLSDEDFINNINQFDILIENTNNTDEILTIEEVVLSNFNKKIIE